MIPAEFSGQRSTRCVAGDAQSVVSRVHFHTFDARDGTSRVGFAVFDINSEICDVPFATFDNKYLICEIESAALHDQDVIPVFPFAANESVHAIRNPRSRAYGGGFDTLMPAGGICCYMPATNKLVAATHLLRVRASN